MIPSIARIDDGPGRLMRALGAVWCEYREGKLRGWRMRWGEFYLREPLLAFQFGLYGDDNHLSVTIAPFLFSAYIRLPFSRPDHDYRGEAPRWGFTMGYGDFRSVHFNWGHRTKIIDMPWAWEHVRHDVLCTDATWKAHKFDWELAQGEEPLTIAKETHPYRYVLSSGVVQERTATITVEEREWRWKWLRWLPFPRRIRRYINVEFSDEVGERSGSWKGGCIGCSEAMRPGETPSETLYRMQRERDF